MGKNKNNKKTQSETKAAPPVTQNTPKTPEQLEPERQAELIRKYGGQYNGSPIRSIGDLFVNALSAGALARNRAFDRVRTLVDDIAKERKAKAERLTEAEKKNAQVYQNESTDNGVFLKQGEQPTQVQGGLISPKQQDIANITRAQAAQTTQQSKNNALNAIERASAAAQGQPLPENRQAEIDFKQADAGSMVNPPPTNVDPNTMLVLAANIEKSTEKNPPSNSQDPSLKGQTTSGAGHEAGAGTSGMQTLNPAAKTNPQDFATELKNTEQSTPAAVRHYKTDTAQGGGGFKKSALLWNTGDIEKNKAGYEAARQSVAAGSIEPFEKWRINQNKEGRAEAEKNGESYTDILPRTLEELQKAFPKKENSDYKKTEPAPPVVETKKPLQLGYMQHLSGARGMGAHGSVTNAQLAGIFIGYDQAQVEKARQEWAGAAKRSLDWMNFNIGTEVTQLAASIAQLQPHEQKLELDRYINSLYANEAYSPNAPGLSPIVRQERQNIIDKQAQRLIAAVQQNGMEAQQSQGIADFQNNLVITSDQLQKGKISTADALTQFNASLADTKQFMTPLQYSRAAQEGAVQIGGAYIGGVMNKAIEAAQKSGLPVTNVDGIVRNSAGIFNNLAGSVLSAVGDGDLSVLQIQGEAEAGRYAAAGRAYNDDYLAGKQAEYQAAYADDAPDFNTKIETIRAIENKYRPVRDSLTSNGDLTASGAKKAAGYFMIDPAKIKAQENTDQITKDLAASVIPSLEAGEVSTGEALDYITNKMAGLKDAVTGREYTKEQLTTFAQNALADGIKDYAKSAGIVSGAVNDIVYALDYTQNFIDSQKEFDESKERDADRARYNYIRSEMIEGMWELLRGMNNTNAGSVTEINKQLGNYTSNFYSKFSADFDSLEKARTQIETAASGADTAARDKDIIPSLKNLFELQKTVGDGAIRAQSTGASSTLLARNNAVIGQFLEAEGLGKINPTLGLDFIDGNLVATTDTGAYRITIDGKKIYAQHLTETPDGFALDSKRIRLYETTRVKTDRQEAKERAQAESERMAREYERLYAEGSMR